MNDEIGLDEDIEPTADTIEGVKGGAAPGSKTAALDAAAELAEKTSSLGASTTAPVSNPLTAKA